MTSNPSGVPLKPSWRPRGETAVGTVSAPDGRVSLFYPTALFSSRGTSPCQPRHGVMPAGYPCLRAATRRIVAHAEWLRSFQLEVRNNLRAVFAGPKFHNLGAALYSFLPP